MQRVCLNLIVKDESPVIERCLRSVRPFIDHWVIVDTGSTDDTAERIQRFFAGDVPGTLHHRPWRHFGHNRSEALALAQPHGDYVLVIDADQVLHLPEGYRRPPLQGMAYGLTHVFNGVEYTLPRLIDSALPWRWHGVLHEYLDCGQPLVAPPLPQVRVQVFTDGARSRRSAAEKFGADAQLLEAALREDPNNPRHLFYLAQSYRDAGQPQAALARYDQRAALGGWVEETFCARLAAALLAEQLQHPFEQVLRRYLLAYECRPERGGEALGQLARYCRSQQHWALALLFAQRAHATPEPQDALFVEVSWYRWRAQDELAIASYWAGHPQQCLSACQVLLAGSALPESERPRVQENLRFARERLG